MSKERILTRDVTATQIPAGNPITLTADVGSYPQINQNSANGITNLVNDPTTPQLGSLRTQHQTSLPLIQMPAQNRVPTSNGLRYPRAVGHSTTI